MTTARLISKEAHAEAVLAAEEKQAAEARRASKTEATGSQTGTMALETVSSLDRQHAVPDLL